MKADESKQEGVRQTTGTTITRWEDPPKQDPDTSATDPKSKDEQNDRRTTEDTTTTDPPDRPGVGKGRDESKEKYPGKGEATGLDKNKKTEVDPDSGNNPAPDRPGVGKGRDESKEQYPGKGEATGLEKQQDKNKENPGQEKAKSDDKKDDGKPDSRGSTNAQDKQPEQTKEPVTTERPSPATAPMLEIPAKELPAPGKCRVWVPGLADRDQAKAGKCENVESSAPAGSWVLSRPSRDRSVVQVKVIDGRRAGVVTRVLSYEVATGKLIGEGGRR